MLSSWKTKEEAVIPIFLDSDGEEDNKNKITDSVEARNDEEKKFKEEKKQTIKEDLTKRETVMMKKQLVNSGDRKEHQSQKNSKTV